MDIRKLRLLFCSTSIITTGAALTGCSGAHAALPAQSNGPASAGVAAPSANATRTWSTDAMVFAGTEHGDPRSPRSRTS